MMQGFEFASETDVAQSALGLESVILIGDSSGGSIAVDYALRHLYRVSARSWGRPWSTRIVILKATMAQAMR